jgi:hypothetical protein
VTIDPAHRIPLVIYVPVDATSQNETKWQRCRLVFLYYTLDTCGECFGRLMNSMVLRPLAAGKLNNCMMKYVIMLCVLAVIV